jgi:hypothetical protein
VIGQLERARQLAAHPAAADDDDVQLASSWFPTKSGMLRPEPGRAHTAGVQVSARSRDCHAEAAFDVAGVAC